MLAEALGSQRKDFVVATKVGFRRYELWVRYFDQNTGVSRFRVRIVTRL